MSNPRLTQNIFSGKLFVRQPIFKLSSVSITDKGRGRGLREILLSFTLMQILFRFFSPSTPLLLQAGPFPQIQGAYVQCGFFCRLFLEDGAAALQMHTWWGSCLAWILLTGCTEVHMPSLPQDGQELNCTEVKAAHRDVCLVFSNHSNFSGRYFSVSQV